MKKISFVLLILFSLVCFSQSKSEKMLGSWYMYHGNHQISDKFLLQSGFQIRTYGVIENHNLSFGYLGIGYKTKSKVLFTLKYGYVEIDRSFEFNDLPNAIEHRIMEDLAYTIPLKSHKIALRLRLEHRFIHFIDSNIEQHRLRYRIGYLYPIIKKMVFEINNEVFLKTTGEAFTENRFYVGTKLKIMNTLSVKLGYMKQYINNLHLNRLQVGINMNTSFK